MSHHLVEAASLCYSYPDGTAVLRDISFRITHGEAVALVGPNGAGKSTLLLHLNGCLLPSSGSLRVGDVPVTRDTLATVRRAVGLVFHDPDDQLFMPSVLEDAAFGPLHLGFPPAEAEAAARKALEAVGIAHLAGRHPHRLSAGEKRAAAIASVLSMSPDILVLDEPTSNLDPRARRRLIGILKGFVHTKIIATHDLDLALEVCTRVILLHEGRVAADGPSHVILRDGALLRSSGLELPLSLGTGAA